MQDIAVLNAAVSTCCKHSVVVNTLTFDFSVHVGYPSAEGPCASWMILPPCNSVLRRLYAYTGPVQGYDVLAYGRHMAGVVFYISAPSQQAIVPTVSYWMLKQESEGEGGLLESRGMHGL